MERKITATSVGYETQDGANVKLVRVLSRRSAKTFDPILMLDSFDTTDPEDYKGGFPLHPHRGIETISYVYHGGMRHRDTLGNEDTVGDGEVQWMTAGSGIQHEETIPVAERMLGVQLWLNLPKKDKFAPPGYKAVSRDEIQEIPFEGGYLRLLAGAYGKHRGYQSNYLPLDYYDVHLERGAKLTIPTKFEKSVMIFTLKGRVKVDGEEIPEKTAVKFGEGDQVTLEGLEDENYILFISSDKLDEPIAWAGPIVMNTQEELEEAFSDLKKGTFIRESLHIEE
ncbi:MAG: pirin family protein [Tissierellia bacterium]|nr:pirin family protein [Tissierellia bacterium]